MAGAQESDYESDDEQKPPRHEFTQLSARVDLLRGSSEKKWWEAANIEPMEIAQRLWHETHDHASTESTFSLSVFRPGSAT